VQQAAVARRVVLRDEEGRRACVPKRPGLAEQARVRFTAGEDPSSSTQRAESERDDIASQTQRHSGWDEHERLKNGNRRSGKTRAEHAKMVLSGSSRSLRCSNGGVSIDGFRTGVFSEDLQSAQIAVREHWVLRADCLLRVL